MTTPNEAIAYSLVASQRLLLWYVEDLTPQEFLHRPHQKVNCAAWLLGHLTLTDRQTLRKVFGVTDLPALPEGFEKRFSRDEGCPQAAEFGDVRLLAPLFARHRELLIETVRSADPADLAKPLPMPHPRFKSAGEAAAFMAIHTAMHAGQITVIRRSLGRPPLI
jgi:hypothetical protein